MSSSSIPGTNVPPISFPGISSGIDYNSIINQLTSLTLAPEAQVNAQLATLNSANSELIQINGLLASVQNSLASLSDPNLFDAYDAISGNLNAATAQGIVGTPAVAGTYVIDSTQVATSTQVESSLTSGHNINDNLTSGPYSGQSSAAIPLIDSYAAVTPTNGTGGQGKVTIDGVTVTYDVTTQSLNTIVANINTAVQGVDPSFSLSVNAAGVAQIADNSSVTLGSAGDQGNLLTVLKLDSAQIVNHSPGYTVTGTSGIGGINYTASLDATTAAGFILPVTSGTFTINGVSLSVSASGDNLASVIARINSSNAGVTASYDASSNQVTLTNNATGPQSIVLGSSGDSSNFLSAVGLTGPGATTIAGAQAQVVIQTPSGGAKTIYSNSNQVTDAIAGVQLNLQSSVSGSPFTVNVTSDTSQLVSAVNTFISAYNAAISAINVSTAPPVVTAAPAGSIIDSAKPPVFSGGILYGNADVGSIKNELTDLVSGFLGSQGQGYNSLSQLGIQLSDSFTTLTTGNNSSSSGSTGGDSASSGGAVQATTFQGTDGTLQPLDVATLQAALAANPNAVQDVLNGAQGLTNQIGGYLTGVTGLPTQLNSGLVGTIPTVSIIQGFENSNTSVISELQAEIATIQNNANQQANNLRSEFVASETAIAGYQALQQQVNADFGTTSSSTGSGL
jgi:flagellar hook-associated protein 2